MSLENNSVVFATDMNFIQPETLITNEVEPTEQDLGPQNDTRKRKEKIVDGGFLKKSKYQVREGCPAKCRKQCSSVIDETARININSYFWSLSFSERRLWLDSYILIAPVKTRTANETEHSRSNSLQYSLPVASTKLPVCKTMFLSTLGLKTDGMITEFVKAKTDSNTSASKLIQDKRGSAPNPTKLDEEAIKSHIESFNPQVSHYKLDHAPHRRYIEPHLTIAEMRRDYNSKHTPSISYSAYERVFLSMNIGRKRPSQDDCDVCETLKNHDHNEEDCKVCTSITQYRERANKARHEYHKDTESREENVAKFTVDMQKILLLPKMTTKEHFL